MDRRSRYVDMAAPDEPGATELARKHLGLLVACASVGRNLSPRCVASCCQFTSCGARSGRQQHGVAAGVLAELGIDLSAARAAVEFVIGRGDRTVGGDIGLTPRAKRVLEYAVREAKVLAHDS